jgi:hypothetical protein
LLNNTGAANNYMEQNPWEANTSSSSRDPRILLKREGWWAHMCTNPGSEVARASIFYMVTYNICGSAVWNWLLVTLLAPRIWRWFLDIWKICEPSALLCSQKPTNFSYPHPDQYRPDSAIIFL